ncbi:Auxin response factor 3 [Hordeum vulgare]|nr:Auxin response factor 3 [Hordeum vulgare]
MEVMEAKERLPKETKGKAKEKDQAWDEVQSVLNKEEVEEVDFLQPYLHLLSPSLIELLRRWALIQQECNKLCATLRSIESCHTSGLDIKDMAFQALEAFKAHHGTKPFTLTHCWTIIHNNEKFKEQYAAIKKNGGSEAIADHGEE